MVTFRILSNIEVHGILFAIWHERNLFMRKGFSRRTANIMATRSVQAVVRA